jgi:hypothetical protein
MTRPASTRDLVPAKPRNQTRDQFARGCRNVCGKPPTPTGPGTAFKRLPGDILIANIGPDGEARTKESGLVLARRREPTAVFVGRDARWCVYRAKEVRRTR